MDTIVEFLKNNSELYKDKIAICEFSNFNGDLSKKEISWDLLYKKAKMLAYAIDKSVSKNCDVVAVLSSNSLEFVLCLYGIVLSGKKALLINSKYTNEAISQVLEIANPELVFYDGDRTSFCFDQFSEIKFISINQNKSPQTNNLENFISTSNNCELVNPIRVLDEGIILLSTSGTSNAPKICIHTNKSINSLIKTCNDLYIKPDDSCLSTFAWYHIGGLDLLLGALLNGNTTYVLYGKKSSQNTLDCIINNEISSTALPVPTITDILQILSSNYKDRDLSFWRTNKSGGQLADKSFLKNWMDIIPNTNFTFGYGMTEGGTVLCSNLSLNNVDNYSYGRINGWDYKLDEDGQLLIKGDGLFKNYFKNEAESKKAFVDGWYCTGDLAQFNLDNTIQIVGRSSDLIVCGAENINPIEVESFISSRLNIKDIVAVAIPDKKFEEQVAVVVEPMENSEISIEEIEEVCQKLPMHMRPKKIKIASIEKSAIGKLNRKQLSKKYFG